MNETRQLTKKEYNILRENFPVGGDFHGQKNIPDWVNQVCKNVRRELIEAGILLPYAESIVIGLGAGSEFKIITEGRLICANSKDGTRRIAFLFGEEDVWLIAAWDEKTGEEIAFPVKGRAVPWPDKNKKEEIAIIRQEALQQANADLKRMEQKVTRELITMLLIVLIVSSLFWFYFWWGGQ